MSRILYYLVVGQYLLIPASLAFVYHVLSGNRVRAEQRTRSSDRVKLLAVVVLLLTTGFNLASAHQFPDILRYGLLFAMIGVTFWIVTDPVAEVRPIIPIAIVTIVFLTLLVDVVFGYHYYYGGTDTINQAQSVSQLLETGEVASIHGIYEAFPLWIIFVSGVQQLTGSLLADYQMMQLLSVLLYAAIPAAVVITFRPFVRTQTCLIAGLLLATSAPVLYHGSYAVSRSIVPLLFLLLVFYLLVPRVRARRFTAAVPLGLIATITIMHPASPPFLFVILAALTAAAIYFDSSNLTAIAAYSGVFLAFVALYWSAAAPELIDTVGSILVDDSSAASGEGYGTPPSVTEGFTTLYHFLPYSLFVFAIAYLLPGWFNPLGDRREFPVESDGGELSGRDWGMIFAVSIPLIVVSIPSPLTLMETFTSMNLDRFGLYTMPILVIVPAAAILSLLRSHPGGAAKFVLGGLVVTLCFIGATHPMISPDRSAVAVEDSTKSYFTESEHEGITHAVSYSNESIFGDYPTTRYLKAMDPELGHIIVYGPRDDTLLVPPERNVLLRDGEVAERSIKIYPAEEYVHQPGYDGRTHLVRNPDLITNAEASADRVYDSDEATLLRTHSDSPEDGLSVG